MAALELYCEGADARLLDIWQLQSQNRKTEEMQPLEVDMLRLQHMGNASYLEYLSQAMLLPSHTLKIAEAYYPLVIDLVSRWWTVEDKQVVLGALSQIVYICPVVKEICMAYVTQNMDKLPTIQKNAVSICTRNDANRRRKKLFIIAWSQLIG